LENLQKELFYKFSKRKSDPTLSANATNAVTTPGTTMVTANPVIPLEPDAQKQT
jgi:hypothetical protein